MDDDTSRLLASMQARGGPALHELAVADARMALKAISAQLDLPPAPVASVYEHTIESAGAPPLRVRIYANFAAAPGQPLRPVLMLLHGGGFILGDLDTHDPMCRYYAAHAGVVVVSVAYRLAPEHPFPAALEDCGTALDWIARHAASLGGDAGRIALTGDSAGGNLAIATALAAIRRHGPKIARLIPVYPATDLRPGVERYASRGAFGGGEYFLSQRDVDWLMNLYVPVGVDPADPRLSPLLDPALGSLMPTYVVVAGYDLLRDEGLAFAERLRAVGVPVRCRCFDGTIHGFLSFAGAIGAGREALEDICAYLRAELGSAP